MKVGRTPLLGAVLAVLVLAAVLAPSGISPLATPSSGGPSARLGSASAHSSAYSGTARPDVGAPGYGRVGETYDLLDQSLVAGNDTNVTDVTFATTAALIPGSDRLVVASSIGGVGVVDPVNGSLLGTVPAILGAVAVAAGASASEALASDFVDTNVSIFNPQTFRVTGHIALPQAPGSLTYDPDNGEVYVAVPSANEVVPVNLTTHALLSPISVGSDPAALAYDAADQRLFVADRGSTTVTVVSTATNSALGTVPVGGAPSALAYFAAADRLYVANSATHNVSVVVASNATPATSVPFGFGPDGLAIDTVDGFVYVGNTTTNTLVAINYRTNSVIASVSASEGPTALTYDPGTGHLFALERSSDNLTVINPGSNGVIGSIRIGFEPSSVAYDPQAGSLGIAVTDANDLVVVNATTGASIATFRAGGAPAEVVYDPITECFYVANSAGNSVTVVNGTTLQTVTSIAVGDHPTAIVVALAYDYLYVANSYTTGATWDLSTINAANNQVVGTISAGSHGNLAGLAYDSGNGDLYVGSGTTLQVLGALSGSTVASLPLNGCGATTAVVADPAGQRVYAGCQFGSVAGSVDSSLAVVNTSSNTVASYVALASGVTALDYDTANGVVYAVQGAFLGGVTAINGSSSTILGDPGDFLYGSSAADSGARGQVYVPEQISPVIAIVTLPGLGEYPVNFTAVGLPAGTTWSLNALGKTWTPSGGSVVVVAPDGTLAFSVHSPTGFNATPGSGNVTIDGSVVDVAISFHPLPTQYSVNFVEQGLPSGTNWSVKLGTMTNGSLFSTITFHAANGSLAYTVESVAGYSANPTGGTVTVNGQNQEIQVNFTLAATGTHSAAGGLASLGGLGGVAIAGAAALVGALAGAAVARLRREPDDPAA